MIRLFAERLQRAGRQCLTAFTQTMLIMSPHDNHGSLRGVSAVSLRCGTFVIAVKDLAVRRYVNLHVVAVINIRRLMHIYSDVLYDQTGRAMCKDENCGLCVRAGPYPGRLADLKRTWP